MNVYKLINDNGLEIEFLPLGARIISIKVPDATGKIADVVIGYDTPEEAIAGDGYFGSICGRYANRVASGKFTIDGQLFQLDINNGPNHLHGGIDGFNNRIWDVKKIKKEGSTDAWELSLVSPDGDQKYPGQLSVKVVYSLTPDNSFIIEYEAETTRPTIINLSSHPYFNLCGPETGDILNHELQVMADNYTTIDPVVGTCMGEIASVISTPMDFTKPKAIKEGVKNEHPQVKLADGIDHNYIINKSGNGVQLAVILTDPKSGRKMEVYTDQPGVHIYTGNHFDGSQKGKKGVGIVKYGGIALETQIFPNSPNVAHFPNAILRPGEKYTHTCVFKFVL